MDEYSIEIDQLQDDLVILVVPALHLLVFGRRIDEALSRVRASIAFRVVGNAARSEDSIELVGGVSDW